MTQKETLKNMKAENNILYYTEDYISGKLIEKNGQLTISDYKKATLSQADVSHLVNLLGQYNDQLRHRCLSVYRDAVIIEGVVYNICLSCGDFWKDNEKHYLVNEEEIIELLSKYKKSAK